MPGQATEILDKLFFVERGYLNGNHFVLASDAPVLVDTGYVDGFGETERILAELGVPLSGVKLIVNTHSHCDHVGGNRTIQDLSGCAVAMHRVGKRYIDGRDDRATWWRYYAQRAEFFDCTQALEDGDIVAVGPHEFRVVHAPGHSADGIVLYHPREKLLLSSDTLWENDVATMTLAIEGDGALFSMLGSLEKIASLDVRAAYPGHGKPFADVRGAIERSRKKVDGYIERREKAGDDLLKKLIVYTLLMERSVPADAFQEKLLRTAWFPETVDRYFGGAYEEKYREILESFEKRGIVVRRCGHLSTTVRP